MKTAVLNVRIEPELKAQAEEVMRQIGLTPAVAINLFYRQIVWHQGLPFEVKKPKHPLDLAQMSSEELVETIKKADSEFKDGKGIPLDEVLSLFEKRKDLDIQH